MVLDDNDKHRGLLGPVLLDVFVFIRNFYLLGIKMDKLQQNRRKMPNEIAQQKQTTCTSEIENNLEESSMQNGELFGPRVIRIYWVS